ncbi:unnamed protein product [Arabidopsis halleri]
MEEPTVGPGPAPSGKHKRPLHVDARITQVGFCKVASGLRVPLTISERTWRVSINSSGKIVLGLSARIGPISECFGPSSRVGLVAETGLSAGIEPLVWGPNSSLDIAICAS